MTAKPNWFYDEMKHAGVDYSDPAQMAVYDGRHQKFRDYRKNAEAIVDALKLGPEHTVIDMGVGIRRQRKKKTGRTTTFPGFLPRG